MLVKLTAGVNFINILQAAFALSDPKSVINRLEFMLGAWRFSAPRARKLRVRMLMKLTLGQFVQLVSISPTFYEQLFRTNVKSDL